MTNSADRVPIEPQSIDAPLSRAAVFLVLSIDADARALAKARQCVADIGSLTRAVGFRDLRGRLSCNVGIGSAAWDRLGQPRRPAQLRPFQEIHGPAHTAVATPGDLLFHIRADRPDMCFDLERLILQTLGDAVRVEDEVHGFRYFDSRDLLGFVDGTENPTGSSLIQSSLIQSDDAPFEGGSYIVELEDTGGRESHKTLTTIVDADGVEHDILRDNMPFGRPGISEYGTYFIGYARNLWVIERMLRNMFLGITEGRHDRVLDFSTPVTGTTFFAPSNSVLQTLAGPA